MDLRDLLSNLTDPEKEQHFHSDTPDEYILLGEYIDWLEQATQRAEKRGGALPADLRTLIELLLEIESETSGSELSAVYSEGTVIYLDRTTGKILEGDPFDRWCEYVATNPKWKRALALAEAVRASLA